MSDVGIADADLPPGVDRQRIELSDGDGVDRELSAAGDEADADHFRGWAVVLRPLSNGHRCRFVYKLQQLEESVFPALKREFQESGFGEVPWVDFLRLVTTGGEVTLEGPKFINRKSYNPVHMMETVFMRRERAFAMALLTIVFSKASNVPYKREPVSLEAVATRLKFDASIALRKTTVIFHAENASHDDIYRIIIEGEGKGKNLHKHRFKFQPSESWLCHRYPEI